MLIYSGLKLIASPALSDGDGTGFIALTAQFVVDGCRSSLELGHESVDLNGSETCKAFGLSGLLGADRAPCKRNFDEQNSPMGNAKNDLPQSSTKGAPRDYANLNPTRNLPAFPQGEPAREADGEVAARQEP